MSLPSSFLLLRTLRQGTFSSIFCKKDISMSPYSHIPPFPHAPLTSYSLFLPARLSYLYSEYIVRKGQLNFSYINARYFWLRSSRGFAFGKKFVKSSPWSVVSFEKLVVAHLFHDFSTLHQPKHPFLDEKYDQNYIYK
jgi:hypothetical protein